MHARSLENDLLAIEGVEHAEVDGDPGAPSGLRIRVTQGADQAAVGESIRRVLSAHGLGTDTRLPGEARERSAGVGSMASVSELGAQSAAAAVATLVSLVDEEPVDDAPSRSGQVEEPRVEKKKVVDGGPLVARVTIERVSVEEGRSGIVVTVVSSDGQSETELARTSEGGVEQAVVLAAARLASPGSPDPIVIEIEERRIEGVDIVMIVIDDNGTVKAGSAVVGAGQAFALGRATWAAMLT